MSDRGFVVWFTGLSGAGKTTIAHQLEGVLRDRGLKVEVLVGDFVEVYAKCPIEVLQERDVKGLYAKALKGEVANFTGVSDPYEEPLNAEVVLETDEETEEESLAKLVAKLEELGYLAPVSEGVA